MSDPARESAAPRLMRPLGVAFFTINRFGLRGPLPEVPKPGGRLRIVCLGGSTTFGMSVNDGEDWPAELDRVRGDQVEVVNAGRPGATTFRNYTNLRDRLREMPILDVASATRALDLYREVTRGVAREEEVPLVDLAALMTRDLATWTDTVHFTPEGERELAGLLAEALRETGLPEPGRER